ncbi:PAS domain-containing protein [Methylobacterium segetis]|uniref:PAS domain-containing protein n=1 Tax=Methylobacterium segetis TaxID=2488750 RepID=UPI001049D371|nr:PAS domain-containing protein [Methylobacterium segetis]
MSGMIWATDSDGLQTYVSPEWCTFTGQQPGEVLGLGWLDAVHPDDRDHIRMFFLDATASREEFTMRYRLRHTSGRYIWVVDGAVPSFGPPHRTFLGYLGSVVEIAPSASDVLTAFGSKGSFQPPVSRDHEPARSPFDLIADHVLIAHTFAAETGDKEVKRALDLVLRVLRVRLNAAPHEPYGAEGFH